jgi:hypothetical protein
MVSPPIQETQPGLLRNPSRRKTEGDAPARRATTQLLPRPTEVKTASLIVREEESAAKESSNDKSDDETDKTSSKSDRNDADRPVSRKVEKTAANDDSQKETAKSSESKSSDKGDAEETTGSVDAQIVGSEGVVTGKDSKELDAFERVFAAVMDSLPNRPYWTVFYLKTADATEAASLLEKLIPQSTVTSTASSGNDSPLGGFFSPFSNFGRNMMNATSLNNSLGTANNLRIITDVRANALFVTGPVAVVNDVESILMILDAADLPQSRRDKLPRMIPVEYADIEEVAEIIENVFKDVMAVDPAQQQQQMNPFAMMFAGNNRQNNNQRKQGPELTIGIDRRTSNLIVSCNDTLFKKVEQTVQTIDEQAKAAKRTVRIVPLNTADPEVVQATLTSLVPKITVKASTPRTRKKEDQAANPMQNQMPGQGMGPGGQGRQMQQGGGNNRNQGGGGNNRNQGGGGGGGNRNQGGGNNRGGQGGR